MNNVYNSLTDFRERSNQQTQRTFLRDHNYSIKDKRVEVDGSIASTCCRDQCITTTLNNDQERLTLNYKPNNNHQTHPGYSSRILNNRSLECQKTITKFKQLLALESDIVYYYELFIKLNIDPESIQSFNSYAKYLEQVNPICNPNEVDTAEKLIKLLGK